MQRVHVLHNLGEHGWGVFVDDLVVPEIIDRKWGDNLPKFWAKKKKL
jgi:hypothetical protein